MKAKKKFICRDEGVNYYHIYFGGNRAAEYVSEAQADYIVTACNFYADEKRRQRQNEYRRMRKIRDNTSLNTEQAFEIVRSK